MMWGSRRAAWPLLCAGLVLAGCALGPDKPKPKELEPMLPQIAGRMVWSHSLDKVAFPLVVPSQGGVFTVAVDDGTIVAFDAASGAQRWRATVDGKISAGVGSDGRFAAIVTQAGELVTLEAGRVLWRQPVGSRVATPPLVAGERVFVLGVDRSVHAFDALDGRRLWRQHRPGDPLTLTQAGVLSAFKNTLVVGQGARLAGLDPSQGSLRWEVALATPRGTNEVERLADLVGPAVRIADRVCARAFQATVGCVDAEQGTLLWSKNVGGTEGVAGDEDYLFGADGSGRLSAWRLDGGELAWSSEQFLYHELGRPISAGNTLVFGDAKGFVQWLSRDKGAPLLRLPTDGSAVVGAPAVWDKTMLVVTRSGGVFAFRPD